MFCWLYTILLNREKKLKKDEIHIGQLIKQIKGESLFHPSFQPSRSCMSAFCSSINIIEKLNTLNTKGKEDIKHDEK